jgi:hypothetical protein
LNKPAPPAGYPQARNRYIPTHKGNGFFWGGIVTGYQDQERCGTPLFNVIAGKPALPEHNRQKACGMEKKRRNWGTRSHGIRNLPDKNWGTNTRGFFIKKKVTGCPC